MSNENQFNEFKNPDDQLDTALKVVSFCFPFIGGIIYFSNRKNKPIKAKQACNAALWGFGIGIILNIIGAMARG